MIKKNLYQDVLFIWIILLILQSGCVHLGMSLDTGAGTLDKEGFQGLYGKKYPIKFTKTEDSAGIKDAIEYHFSKTDPYHHHIVEIQFSEVGSLLDKVGYEKAIEKSLTFRNPEQHQQYFPNLGARAQYSFLGAGPGGAAEQLVFTTTNAAYDVKILVSHLLPVNVDVPEVGLKDIARYIDQSILAGRKR